MALNLYEHQQRIIDEDPRICGLWLGTGSGKTRIALNLARGSTLVICPKTQRDDRNWERELNTIKNPNDISLTVISKEEFRRDALTLPRFQTVIVDEAHTCLGVTPNTRQRKRVTIPRASQLFEALDWYVETHRPDRLYLCTATIIKSPMTVWGAMKVLGFLKNRTTMQNFNDFRDVYYTLLPMPGREVYVPRRDSETKDKLAAIVRKLGYTGRLEDYFDVPNQIFRTIHIELTTKQKARIKELPFEYPDPIVLLGKKLQIENGVLAGDEFNEVEEFDNGKIEKILELAEEFPKMVIFAKYTAQINQIWAAFRDAGYSVAPPELFLLTGQTNDRGRVLELANAAKGRAIFIAQAQISAGWELPDYPTMVFASRTYSYVDYAQALGRIQRANNIKKNLYINLVVRDGVDEAVDRSLINKQDFDARIYLNI